MLTVRIMVPEPCRMHLEIRDYQGKLLDSRTEKLMAGEFKMQMKLDGYAPGLYYFNFVIDTSTFVKRIMVLWVFGMKQVLILSFVIDFAIFEFMMFWIAIHLIV